MTSLPMDAECARKYLQGAELTAPVPVAAGALSMSVPGVYGAVRDGKFPIEAIRVGRTIRFRTSDLRALVGIDQP